MYLLRLRLTKHMERKDMERIHETVSDWLEIDTFNNMDVGLFCEKNTFYGAPL